MAEFPGENTKKELRLGKKVRLLRRLIEQGADRNRLLEAASEVRDGRVRALSAKQYMKPRDYFENRAIHLANERALNSLRAVTAEEVLAEFVKKHRETE